MFVNVSCTFIWQFSLQPIARRRKDEHHYTVYRRRSVNLQHRIWK